MYICYLAAETGASPWELPCALVPGPCNPAPGPCPGDPCEHAPGPCPGDPCEPAPGPCPDGPCESAPGPCPDGPWLPVAAFAAGTRYLSDAVGYSRTLPWEHLPS